MQHQLRDGGAAARSLNPAREDILPPAARAVPAAAGIQSYEKLLIVDTDMGVDDVVALTLALKARDVRVLAITTCFGNVTVRQASRNVGVVCHELKLAPWEIMLNENFDPKAGNPGNLTHVAPPCFTGADVPLVDRDEPLHIWPGHGVDGMGNAVLQTRLKDHSNSLNAAKRQRTSGHETAAQGAGGDNDSDNPVVGPSDIHAAQALVELARTYPGRITLVTLGPLTNVALAVRLDPKFASNIAQLYVMGGSVRGKGNATLSSEFNFHCDPEAAHIVLSSFGMSAPSIGDDRSGQQQPTMATGAASSSSSVSKPKISLVTWEVTERSHFTWKEFNRMVCDTSSQSNSARSDAAKVVLETCKLWRSMSLQKRAASHAASTPRRLSESKKRSRQMRDRAVHGQEETKVDVMHNSGRNTDEIENGDGCEDLDTAWPFMPCDAYAMACALDDGAVVTKAEILPCSVELGGNFSRGAVGVDWYKRTPHKRIRVVEAFDVKAVGMMLSAALSEESVSHRKARNRSAGGSTAAKKVQTS